MIYVVRHGQTDWNLAHKIQGRADIELNQTGILQAQELATKMSHIKFDACISSPLKRAIKTAQIIFNSPIQIDERLVERGNGELEGRTDWRELGVNFNDPNETRYNIETLGCLKKRIRSFWEDILKRYPNKNILIVTHAGVAMWSQVYFYGSPENDDLTKYRINNCEVLQIDNHIQPHGY